MSDDTNPKYMMSTTFTELLVKVAKGEIDANRLAELELVNRGLDRDGNWVGFKEAKRIFNVV